MNELKNMIDDLGYDVLGLEKIVYATGVLGLGECSGGSCDAGCSNQCKSCKTQCESGVKK